MMALEHAGFAAVRRGEPSQALALFQQALDVARAVGDPKHEADLLWHQAIQHAELGRKDTALVHAQAAVAVLRQARHPQAVWFAEHLQHYQSGSTGTSID